MIATTEALALGEANGIDPTVLSEVLRTSSGGNYALEKYSPYPGIMHNVPSSNGFKGGFRSDFQLKDMRLAKQLAAEMKIRTPSAISPAICSNCIVALATPSSIIRASSPC